MIDKKITFTPRCIIEAQSSHKTYTRQEFVKLLGVSAFGLVAMNSVDLRAVALGSRPEYSNLSLFDSSNTSGIGYGSRHYGV